MDNYDGEEKCEISPSFTPNLNESGYVTASPSPFYNFSESESVTANRWTATHLYNETPNTSLKCGKISSLRKNLLEENCDDCQDEAKSSRQSLSSGKEVLKEIQNTERQASNTSTPPTTPMSPPVSPSKIRFNLFVKAGVTLDEGAHLVRCPRCSHPSQATSDQAHCLSVGCDYIFCVSCLCDTHDGFPCPALPSPDFTNTPVRRKLSIGSKESRRNLRRL